MSVLAWFLLFLGTGKGVLAQEGIYFPERNTEWSKAPKKVLRAFDAVSLNAAVSFALDHEYSGSRDLRQAILQGFRREPYHQLLGPVRKRGGPAGLILKNGYIVAQWGDVERVDMTFSVTKSFLSTTAGLAVDRGLIASVTDTVANYIWDGTFDGPHNGSIQWKHLLEQNSDWKGSLWGLHDWADRPPREGTVDDWRLTKPRKPGTVMEYNDVRVNVLAYALTHVWRKPLPVVLKEGIMDPIGASTTWRWFGYEEAWTVIDGQRMKSVTGGGHSGGGMFINSLDMARFGLLFMNGGRWRDRQLISKEWIELATTPSAPNSGYGFLWWLNDGQREGMKDLPPGLYHASGFGGNFIVVDPENQLVIVCRWLEPSQLSAFLNKVYSSLK